MAARISSPQSQVVGSVASRRPTPTPSSGGNGCGASAIGPGLGSQNRAGSHTKREAVDAVRASLDAEIRWHAERGKPLMLDRADKGPNPMTDCLRGPLTLDIGRDVPWPEG